MNRLLAAVILGGAAYFLFEWYVAKSQIRSMTAIERANARIEEAHRREARLSPMERSRRFLVRQGYQGDFTPVVAGVTFLYLVAALVLRFLGLDTLVAAIVALPVCAAAVAYGFMAVALRRRRRFNRQLLEALKLIAGQIEGGNGPQRAIEQTIPSLQDPLRSELAGAMDATVASKDLVQSMKDLEERYPSKALKMFVAALEIDRDKGGRIEPALRQAAATLQRDFDLSQEAVAEVSQTKTEFYAIIGIIGFVIFGMVSGGGEQARTAYLSFIGIVAITAAAANAAFGVWRALRIFKKARGES